MKYAAILEQSVLEYFLIGTTVPWLAEKLLLRHDVALFSIQNIPAGQQNIDFEVRTIMNDLLNVHL